MALFYVTGCKEQQENQLISMNTNNVNQNPPRFLPHRQFYHLPSLQQSSKNKTNHAPKHSAFMSSNRKITMCSRLRVLVFFLVFFVLLSLVMTCLFLWQVQRDHTTAADDKQMKSSGSCISLPKPIPLAKFPESWTEILRETEELIVKEMSSNKDFGALSANLVYRDQIVWRGTFGVMSKSDRRKPNASTVYACASTTKVVTALVVFKLFDEGKIQSLDDPVTLYDPDFKIRNPFNDHNITLRNLLSMTSGIQREAPCYPMKKNNFCPYDHNTMLKRIRNISLLVEPNTLLQYSNLGYSLLGNVMAKRFTGGDYNRLVKTYVLDPLKMDRSTFSPKLRQPPDVPVAYDKDKPVGVFDWGWLNPTGGMFTTVDDLAKMMIELMTDRNKNRYLSKYTTRVLLSAANILPDSITMVGMPWEMKTSDGIIFREKAGSVHGYETKITMVPELRIALNVMCTNCAGYDYKLTNEIFVKKIVPSLKKELQKHEKQNIVLPVDYEAYTGSFTTHQIPFLHSMIIDKRDNKLAVFIPPMPTPHFYLNYTAPLQFRIVVNTDNLSCKHAYFFANEHDSVVFDDISSRDGLSHGFTLFGANPTGKAHFYRGSSKRIMV